MMSWTSSFKLGIRFKCLRCASCCKSVRQGVGLTDGDRLRIREATQRSDFTETISHPVFNFNLCVQQGECFFLDGNECSIYEARPILCRLYPFQVSVRHDGSLLLCLNHCPGVDGPNGELVDEHYVIDEILEPLVRLEGRVFIKKLQAYYRSVKKEVTPLIRTQSGVVHSNWEVKASLEELILRILSSGSLNDLTPWERLGWIYHDVLPLLALQMANRTDLMAVADVLRGYESVRDQIDLAQVDSATQSRRRREKLEQEGRVVYKIDEGFIVAQSSDRIPFMDPKGEEFTVLTGDVLKALLITESAVKKEIEYFEEVLRREGTYGAVVHDFPVDVEILILMRVADALELVANAYAVRKGMDYVGVSEITDAVRRVDMGLTGIAMGIVEGNL